MMLINCNFLGFSQNKQMKRIKWAIQLFGCNTVKKLIFYILYLLGADAKSIAQILDIPIDTFNALIKRIKNDGLPALEDRRCKTSSFLPSPSPSHPPTTQINLTNEIKPSIYTDEQFIYVEFHPTSIIRIPMNNPVQCKAILLTLVNSRILTTKQAASLIGISIGHFNQLKKNLSKNGDSALIDKRTGPQQDYRFTPEIKSEVIQQFFLDVVTEKKTSSEQISKKLKIRCGHTLSARSIGYHLLKLGLNKIKVSFPRLIDQIKKNSQT